jgi:hypothetical protein
MKIYVLLMLISVIVGFSHAPSHGGAKKAVPARPDSLPA